MPRLIVGIAAVLALAAISGQSLALDPGEQARWQVASDRAGITLLVPETPGFTLQRIDARSLTCNGDTLGQAFASWRDAGGRALALAQGRPFPCGNPPESTLLARLAVRGAPAEYFTYDSGAGSAWALTFESQGARLALDASFDDAAALVAIAESIVPIVPTLDSAVSVTELTGRVVKTVGADTVVVNAEGGRQAIALEGIRAPQPASDGEAAGCRFGPARTRLRQALPRGARVMVTTNPLGPTRDSTGRLLGYVSRLTSRQTVQLGSFTANRRLISAGAVRAERASYRYYSQFVLAEGFARSDNKGLFGSLCKGRTGPVTMPPPQPMPPPRPQPLVSPRPQTPGDIYNCEDFPLQDGTTPEQYLERYPSDPSGLDGNNDGEPCE